MVVTLEPPFDNVALPEVGTSMRAARAGGVHDVLGIFPEHQPLPESGQCEGPRALANMFRPNDGVPVASWKRIGTVRFGSSWAHAQ